MDEEPFPRETVEELFERLDHLERVLQSNTERLHAVERRLSIEPEFSAELRGRAQEAPRREEAWQEPLPPPVQPVPPAPIPPPAHDAAPTASAETSNAAPSDLNAPPVTDEPPPEEFPDTPPHVFEGGRGSVFGGSRRAGERVWDEDGGRRKTAGARQEAAAGPKPKKGDFESLVGGRGAAWAGIIAIAFGVAFFLKLAFDRGYVGPTARALVGAAGGVALLGAGEYLRKKGLRHYAFVISGGGVLILYLTIYAAYDFYQLIGQPVAFALMAGVTALAVLLSARLDALPVAILGLVGGFLTPLLLSTGRDNQVGLFSYVALLDAGVLALAYFKRWRSLNFLSFIATVLMTLGWAVAHYAREKLWLTLFFLSLFFVLYALLAVAHNLLPRRPARWYDLLLAGANAAFYFSLSYSLLVWEGYEFAPASHALLVSAFYSLLFYAAFRLHRADRLLAYGFVGAAVTFFTAAVAIRLELQWVSVAWAVEALMLVWAGLRAREDSVRRAGLAVFAVAVAHWFAWDLPEFGFRVGESFVPLLNERAFSCAVLVGTLAAAAWLYRPGADDGVGEDERGVARTFFLLGGNALALTLLTLDVNDYFRVRLAREGGEPRPYRASAAEIARQFSLTALWTFYGAALLVSGLLRRLAVLRYAGFLVMAAAVAKVLALDSSFYDAPTHLPVVNQTFMAYALLVLGLGLAARFYRKAGGLEEEKRAMLPALLSAAALLALGGLSLEAVGYYDRLWWRATEGVEDAVRGPLREGKAFALTLVWTLYGAGLFLWGARRDAVAWRTGGLVVLAAAALKLLAWDVFYYDAAWHAPVLNRTAGAFALVVAALWLVVREYARAGGRFAEGERVRPVATVAANLLAVVGLSAEASGYFAARIRAGGLTDEALRDLQLARQLSLSVVWTIYGGALFLVGRARRSQLLRVLALVLLGLTTLKVFFWDLSSLDRVYRIASFILLGLILLVVSYLYQKSQQRAAEEGEAGDVT